MTERVLPGRLDATLRILGALVGTLPVAVLASACLARLLPLAEGTRLALGFTFAIPLWVVVMSAVFLARTASTAWGVCTAALVILATLVYGVLQ